MRIGYARVSTVDQNPDGQIEALRAAGCEKIYTDRASGASTARPQLHAAIDQLRDGDELVVWRLDRLGRSVSYLVDIMEHFRTSGVQFLSLTEGIDTRTATGRLVFHLFGAIAEFERDLIRERTLLGQRAAQAAGKRGGRKSQLTPKKLAAARRLIAEHEPVSAIAEQLSVSRQSLYRACGPEIADARRNAPPRRRRPVG